MSVRYKKRRTVIYIATMRATDVKRIKKYKRENSALRAIHSFLSDYNQDNLKVVTLISPGNPVQTFTDASEIIVPKTKQRIADSKSWQRLRFKVFNEYGKFLFMLRCRFLRWR